MGSTCVGLIGLLLVGVIVIHSASIGWRSFIGFWGLLLGILTSSPSIFCVGYLPCRILTSVGPDLLGFRFAGLAVWSLSES